MRSCTSPFYHHDSFARRSSAPPRDTELEAWGPVPNGSCSSGEISRNEESPGWSADLSPGLPEAELSPGTWCRSYFLEKEEGAFGRDYDNSHIPEQVRRRRLFSPVESGIVLHGG